MNSDTNRLGSGILNENGENGTGVISTKLGNPINISYAGFTNTPTQWQELCIGGYFYNTTPINGIKSLTIIRGSSNTELGISWLGTSDFAISKNELLTFNASDVGVFDFNGDMPNYIKIFNDSETAKAAISSINITYSCIDEYRDLTVTTNDSSMGYISGTGKYQIGKSVTIEATPKEGYRFVGWYKNGVMVSNNKSYTFTMNESDSVYTARFSKIIYNLIVNANNDNYGTVTGGGYFYYLEAITVTATPNIGYEFIGWFVDDTKVSADNIYIFNMPSDNLTLTAKFEIIYFTANAYTTDSEKGTVSGTTTNIYNSPVTFTATPEQGYAFNGWYDENDQLVTKSNPFNFNMPDKDVTYFARWTPLNYKVTLTKTNNSLGNTEVIGGVSHAYKSEVTITSNTSNPDEYTFGGWYQNNILVSLDETYTFEMPYHNVSFEARYVKLYEVFIEYHESDEASGTYIGMGKYGEGLSYTIRAFPTLRYTLKGWYDESLDLISAEETITDIMPNHDVHYLVSFQKKVLQLNQTYAFGSYPQTNVTDSALVSTLNALAGDLPTAENPYSWTSYEYYINRSTADFMWYQDIEYTDGFKYRGVYFTEYRPFLTSDDSIETNSYQDENGYSTNVIYWFKYEPIRWRVANVSGGDYMLISEILLDATQYYHDTWKTRMIDLETIYQNNYEYSDIRSFLNEDFYNVSFSADEKTIIKNTLVDNSAASTRSNPNEYACGYTSDKVFLLSYQEVTTSSLGFDSDSKRRMIGSDYAKCQGLYVNSGGLSNWWTRSPGDVSEDKVDLVFNNGGFSTNRVDYAYRGVLPALYINL